MSDHDLSPGRRSAAPSGGEDWTGVHGTLPAPAGPGEADDVLWRQLDAQFRWYHRQAARARLAYCVLKVTALVLAGSVTVLAAVGAPAALTATLAAGIVVLEGVQQVFQFHANWISYRTVAEALRAHAFQYAAEVGPYADRSTRRDRLAEAVHALTTGEHATWASTMRQAATPAAPAGT